MNYSSYVNYAEEKFEELDAKQKLFWGLWCLTYPFERITASNPHYELLTGCYAALWNYHDSYRFGLKTLLATKPVKQIVEFDNDIYDDLDDFDVEERSVKELVTGLESIIENLQLEKTVIYNAYETSINVVDIEVGGISITGETTHPIYLNETLSQIQLLEDLIANSPVYTFKERNIYRTHLKV
jgi:hypothetical protein